MMAGEATVVVEGNLGADPELKVTPSGKTVCSFSLAATPRLKDGDNWKDGETTWYRVTLWNRKAEVAVDALRKGMTVLVAGNLENHKYTDKEGNEKFSLGITATNYGIVPKATNSAPKEETKDDFPW